MDISRPTITGELSVALPRYGIRGRIIPKPIRSNSVTKKSMPKFFFLPTGADGDSDESRVVVAFMRVMLSFKTTMIHRSLCFMLLGSVILTTFSAESAERVYTQFHPPRFKAGRLALKVFADQFNSDQNFNSELSYDDIVGERFQTNNLYVGADWDYSYAHNFHFGLLMGRSQSLLNQEERTKTDVKGIEIGGAYKLPFSPKGVKLILDYRYFHNEDINDYDSSDVSIGDAVSWAMLGGWAGTDDFKYGDLWAFLGIKHPFERLSTNLVYQLKLEGKLWGLRAGGGIEGQIPILADREEDNPIPRFLYLDRANAGSLHYMGVNSEFIELGGWVGFELMPYTNLKLGAASPFAGTNSAFGLRFFAQLEVSFSVTSAGYRFPYIKVKRPGGKDEVDPFTKRTKLRNYKKPEDKKDVSN